MILPATPQDVIEFCTRIQYPSADMRAIKFVDDEGIKAMVGYDNWTHTSCMMHVLSIDPAIWKSRVWLREVFSYPFIQCDRLVVLGATPSSLDRALKLAKGVGFKEFARVKDGYAVGDDMVLTEMRREDCRWIKQFEEAA